MAGCDRLSALPDDLLLRVLHFAPLREAASTSALSTRWRGLSRSSGAINLETRVEKDSCGSYVQADDPFLSRRDAFVSAAMAALVASEATVRRLTFRLEGGSNEYSMHKFLYQGKGRDRRIDVVTDLLSHPAARRVEELQLDSGKWSTMLYDLSFLCLPSENLRVLQIAGCKGLKPPAGVFPLLASLRLRSCEFPLEHLQSLIDAAPALTTLHLHCVKLKVEEQGLLRLRCPSATALLLEKYCWSKHEADADRRTPMESVEIDAPRLRRFTYMGLLRPISLSSHAPDLTRVDVHVFHDIFRKCNSIDKNLGREVFWKSLHSFSNAKEMKLRLNHLEDIAVVTAAERTELLRPFDNLGRFELEGLHRPKGKTAAVAIANLLRCCPVLRDLRISLTTAQADSSRNPHYGTCFLERKYRHDLDKSIHGYKRRMIEPMVSIDDEDADDDAVLDQVPDLPVLSGRVFHCLQSSLRCLRLQFRQEKTKCFGRKLIKFFVENALVLEEMRVRQWEWKDV
ncbi:hypothetical protein ACQ4PT_068294 [Festuca glaucescens]